MNQLKDKISFMKYFVLVLNICIAIAAAATAYYTFMHKDEAVYTCALVAFALGIMSIFVNHAKQEIDDRENKKAEEEFQQQLNLAHTEQRKALEDLADANKRAHKSEEEFRLYMTGGDAMPRLRMAATLIVQDEKVGPHILFHLDIDNPTEYPLHDVSIQLVDIFGFDLYNVVRIKRMLTHQPITHYEPTPIDSADYNPEQNIHIPILRKHSNYVPAYTTCYKFSDHEHDQSIMVNVTWGGGTLVYNCYFHNTASNFKIFDFSDVYLNNVKQANLFDFLVFEIRTLG